MGKRKTKRAVYFIREARELFDRTAAFMALTAYTLVSHVSGKHHRIMTKSQAIGVLYTLMSQVNRRNGDNRCAAIPERESGRFVGVRRIPSTPEGRAIVFAYRQNRMDEVNKLLLAQLEIIEADRTKGILTKGQTEKIIGTTSHLLSEEQTKQIE